MIRPLNLELRILLYIISFGIYYFSFTDLVIFIEEKYKLNKIFKTILEIIYLILQVFLTYNFCYNLDYGYIPIYFMLFIIIGFLIYYLFIKDSFIKTLNYLSKIISKITPLFIHLWYSKSIFKTIKITFKKWYLKIKKLFFKKSKKKNQNT